VNAKIDTSIRYIAQKINIPINKKITIFAESGTAYREIVPHRLRYVCKDNIYLKDILPPHYCLHKNYQAGGASYPYFAVGFETKKAGQIQYQARYITIPGQENGNRLSWLDASNTTIYAISETNAKSLSDSKQALNAAIKDIGNTPELKETLVKNFFIPILEENGLYQNTASLHEQNKI